MFGTVMQLFTEELWKLHWFLIARWPKKIHIEILHAMGCLRRWYVRFDRIIFIFDPYLNKLNKIRGQHRLLRNQRSCDQLHVHYREKVICTRLNYGFQGNHLNSETADELRLPSNHLLFPNIVSCEMHYWWHCWWALDKFQSHNPEINCTPLDFRSLFFPQGNRLEVPKKWCSGSLTKPTSVSRQVREP